MTSEAALRRQYEDLLGGDAGRDGDELLATAAVLDAGLGRAGAPPPLAEAIEARARELGLAPAPDRIGLLRLRLTRPRLSAPLVAVAAALLLAASAVAVGLVNRALELDSGARTVTEQMVSVGQTKTAAGYAITIQRAYADANRLIVLYSVRPPQGENDDMASITWASATTADGTALPWTISVMENVAAGAGEGLITFDAAAVRSSPPSIDVRLVVKNIYVVRHGPTPGRTDPVSTAPPDPRLRSVTVGAGFEFSVPFHRGTIVAPNVSASYRGQRATLERLVITPSETRVYVAGTGVADWALLRAPGGRTFEADTVHGRPASGGIAFFIPEPKAGHWTLTVAEKPLGGGRYAETSSNWTFAFDIP